MPESTYLRNCSAAHAAGRYDNPSGCGSECGNYGGGGGQ